MSNIVTGFKKPGGEDLGANLVEKTYLLDRYPELADTFKQAGLWLWGRNLEGTLGVGNLTNRSSPVQTTAGGNNWKIVDCGTDLIGAIKTDGTLWMWGANDFGGVGDGGTAGLGERRSTPVQIGTDTTWKQISVGDGYSGAIKTDGTLWMWGFNDDGQLGDGTTVKKSSPVQTIAGGTNWKQLSVGEQDHTMAIKTDGTLWGWGQNIFGQTANGTRSSPAQVGTEKNWKQVSAGSLYTGAIKTDGTLWMWGINNSGQLGDNSTTNRSTPVQTVSSGTNWKQVSSGSAHTAAIKTDGTLWLWGGNISGQLGDGTVDSKSSPVQTVSGGTNWKQVTVGGYVSAAIKTDGTLWIWGENSVGQLGNNTTTDTSSPVQTIAGGSNWKSIVLFQGVGLTTGGGGGAAIRDSSEDLL